TGCCSPRMTAVFEPLIHPTTQTPASPTSGQAEQTKLTHRACATLMNEGDTAAMKMALATPLAAPLGAALVAPVASPQVSKSLLVRSAAVPVARLPAFAWALESLFAVPEPWVAQYWP